MAHYAALTESPLPRDYGDPPVVHVAVGRTFKKGKDLILWALRHFCCNEIVLVYVHKPSLTIPTPMGNIPVKNARDEVVSLYRKEERKKMEGYRSNYYALCRKEKVKGRFIWDESEDIAEGLLQLIRKHSIRRLVMGTKLDNFRNVKKCFNKEVITAKNAPPSCEIWFIKRGKHIWKQDATEVPGSIGIEQASSHSPGHVRDVSFELDDGHVTSSPIADGNEREIGTADDPRGVLSKDLMADDSHSVAIMQTSSLMEAEGTSRDANHKDGCCSTPQRHLVKERMQDQAICEEPFEKSPNYEELEREEIEAYGKEESLKYTIRRENQIKRELNKTLKSIRRQRKELAEQRDEAASELVKMTEVVAVLERSVEKESRHQAELEKELKIIQASTLSLKIERYKIHQQREEAQRSSLLLNAEVEDRDDFGGLSNGDFLEFELSDLQNATCNFSENFKIGRGSNGCVYKGELLHETVAIKKLHPNSVHLEFEQEVWKLGNLRHPHLVPLIGFCPEALSLVSKHMPNGNLDDRLSRRYHSTSCWIWQERTQTASEIAAAILFLHSIEPDGIIHGDLKPENILFDSDFSCKIGDFGISRFVKEGSLHCPSFRRYSESTSPPSYSDPEYHRTGKLTPKSDVYSFGIVLLQMLTGRPLAGLVNQVRRAMLEGKLSSLLDLSAGEWPLYVATRLAELGLQCCEGNSRNRPELTNVVVRELQRLHVVEEQEVPHFFLCPILKEIMHDPHVAADGYTYEGEAFRSWIEHGHDTSPMTNVKLDNLNSTPNRALRIAIQEWLSVHS